MRNQKFRGNIFVTNLPPGYTDEKLAAHFDDFGLVLGAFLARDPETGAPKNYGLVNIAPDRVAAEAIAELDGLEVDGRRIRMRPADPEMGLTIPTRRSSSRPSYAPRSAPQSAPRSFVVERLPSRRAAPTRGPRPFSDS